jgi:nitrite reductase/ring-hydroxylating ferredoxin subunit
MATKTIKWFKVADIIEAIDWHNNLAIAEVGGKTITLARSNNQIFACAHKCPHASGILADGFLDATGNIVCPLHRYKFNLGNGRNVTGEGYYLKTYAIEMREAGIFVGFEEGNWLSFLK